MYWRYIKMPLGCPLIPWLRLDRSTRAYTPRPHAPFCCVASHNSRQPSQPRPTRCSCPGRARTSAQARGFWQPRKPRGWRSALQRRWNEAGRRWPRVGLEIWGEGFHVYLSPFGGRKGRKISNEDILPDPSWHSRAATVHGALDQYRPPASPLTISLSCRAGLYLPTPRLATLAQTVDLFSVSTPTHFVFATPLCISPRHDAPPATVGAVSANLVSISAPSIPPRPVVRPKL